MGSDQSGTGEALILLAIGYLIGKVAWYFYEDWQWRRRNQSKKD